MTDMKVTYGVPRFLAFVEAAYLREAMTAALEALDKQRLELASSDRERLGNLNATDQALRRAFFIGAFAILEQNLDEIVSMAGARLGKRLKPQDLREGGVKRSLAFAEKVLEATVDLGKSPWQDLSELQKLRNHLVHYGAGFSSSSEHQSRRRRFEKIPGVELRPMICFEDGALDEFLTLFVQCVSTLSDCLPELPPQEATSG